MQRAVQYGKYFDGARVACIDPEGWTRPGGKWLLVYLLRDSGKMLRSGHGARIELYRPIKSRVGPGA